MKNTEALRKFITDDQILAVLVKWDDNRKMESAKMLQAYLFPAWQTTILDCVGIIQNIKKEF